MQGDDDKIATASTALQSLINTTNAKTMTKKETVLQLRKDIVAARAKGKTWNEITKTINDVGINVTCAYIRATMKTKVVVNKKKEGATQNKIQKNNNVTMTATGMGRNVIRPDSEDL